MDNGEIVYYTIVGLIILIIAFFMAATQKARGYNFWKYFIISNVALWVLYFMIDKFMNSPQ